MKLEWSEISDPNDECCYTHTVAQTPFGRFQLTWKGWKEDISASMGFDETPWGDVVYDWWNSIDEAKQWAEDEMNKRLTELVPSKVAELEGQNKMLLGVVSGDIGFACELTKMLEERDASLSPEQREAEQQASQKRAAEIIKGIDFSETAEAEGSG